MKYLALLLFIIPLSLFGQVESQFNGTLNIFSGSRIGTTNTFTVSGIFNSTTSSFTSNQVAVGDVVQTQSGSRFYWFHIYSIASSSGGAITCNVRDSSSTITVAPVGIVNLFRPTTNRRLPLTADGISNAARASAFNTLALRVDQLGSGTGSANCEQTLTKTSHGFRKWTPIYWNETAWVRPAYDSIIPTYIVIDSTSVNTFKVANCGNYATSLTAGMYWFTGTSPGYTTTPGTVKTALFEVAQGRLILQPLTGFNLATTGGGSADGNGIISALPLGDINIVGAISSDLRIQNTRSQFDGKFKVGTDSSFIHDPAVDSTLFKGKFAIKNNTNYYSLPITSPGTGTKIIEWVDGVPSFNTPIVTLKGSATLDFPSTSSNGASDLTITVTGAADGDVVSLGIPNASATIGLFFAWVSATNTVTVRFHNTSGGSTNPVSGTFKVIVTK
jgi:hypothetical protein